MNQDQSTVSCPECGYEIDVNEILAHQIEAQLKKQFQDELKAERRKYDAQAADLAKQKEALEADKAKQAEMLDAQVKAQLKEREAALKAKYKKDAAEEQAGALEILREELDEKSKKLGELNKTTAELEKTKRAMAELEEKTKAETEKLLNERIVAEREKIQKDEDAKNELKFKELQKQLEDQKKLTEEMKRKQEQGSMQLQGEVQELVIEEFLREQFPLDVIDEIKKGERGADCLQVVHTRTRQNCGSIYYESKRTKTFNQGWIEKFKADIQSRNASIGVLVTEAMPADMDRLGLRDGVWVCSYDEFKGLCTVLRESVIAISTAVVTQDNKGDKMGMLYDFLTSKEFHMQVEGIVEGFTQMEADLKSEQRAMRSIWKKREKQIEKVLLNTTGMFGSVRGIAGSAIQSIPLLELPGEEQGNLLEDDSQS